MEVDHLASHLGTTEHRGSEGTHAEEEGVTERDLAGEAGEFEMGVGVDQARQEDAVGEVLTDRSLRCRYGGAFAGRHDPASIVDEHCPIGDGRRTHRHQP